MRGAALAALALAALAGGAPRARAASGPAVPILMYHHIAPAGPHARLPALWVGPAAFDAHVRALRRAGYRAVTLERVGTPGTTARRSRAGPSSSPSTTATPTRFATRCPRCGACAGRAC